MWCENLASGESWSSLWHGYILCGNCAGIRRSEGECPACGDPSLKSEPIMMRSADGREHVVYQCSAGAEGRYEDYVYLQMLQREWERPAPEFERFASFANHERPSARVALVILFWTYFETRMERLLRGGMHALPERIREDLLDRYSSIGARLYQLYRIVFGKNYFEDLTGLGFGEVATLLLEVHKRRNEFTHGKPQAIDDATVLALVGALKTEHEAWIAAFNKRATKLTPPCKVDE